MNLEKSTGGMVLKLKRENKLFINELWHNCDKQRCHTIVFMGDMGYSCDEQKYHKFALYKRLFSRLPMA